MLYVLAKEEFTRARLREAISEAGCTVSPEDEEALFAAMSRRVVGQAIEENHHLLSVEWVRLRHELRFRVSFVPDHPHQTRPLFFTRPSPYEVYSLVDPFPDGLYPLRRRYGKLLWKKVLRAKVAPPPLNLEVNERALGELALVPGLVLLLTRKRYMYLGTRFGWFAFDPGRHGELIAEVARVHPKCRLFQLFFLLGERLSWYALSPAEAEARVALLLLRGLVRPVVGERRRFFSSPCPPKGASKEVT